MTEPVVLLRMWCLLVGCVPCWGNGSQGKLVHGAATDPMVPTRVGGTR